MRMPPALPKKRLPASISVIRLATSLALLGTATANGASTPGNPAAAALLPVPQPNLNKILPINWQMAAAMPSGPQLVSISITFAAWNFEAYTAVGYTNFTSADEAGCSSDITVTQINLSTPMPTVIGKWRVVRTASGGTWQRALVGTSNGPLNVWVAQDDPSLEIPIPTPAVQGIVAANQLLYNSGVGFCMFTELDRYVSFKSGNAGTLRINFHALNQMNAIGSMLFATEVVNALHPSSLAAATSARNLFYKTVSRGPASAAIGHYSWTLQHVVGGTIFTASQVPNGFREVITITPTTKQKVPNPHGQGPVARTIQAAGGANKLRKTLGLG